jgi:ubiquinone/menaquinone biosynthesis C-methylase UbiE
MQEQRNKTPSSTSWQSVEKWYDTTVGEAGHYYHQHVVIPGVLKLLSLKDAEASVLDLACGQGILGRQLSSKIHYVGLDIAPSFIKAARNYDKNPKHQYLVADVTNPLPLKNQTFSHTALILAVQNIEFPDKAFRHAAQHLELNGSFIIVLNHPCFRIPRQSSWGIDESNKLQYRRINRYMSPLKIPLHAHPSQGEHSASTWSFHHPLSAYTHWLKEAGFTIELMEEWISDKTSTGKAARMENRSRDEFPLFLAILARKVTV